MKNKNVFKYLKYVPGILLGAGFEYILKITDDYDLPPFVGFLIVSCGFALIMTLIDVFNVLKRHSRNSASQCLVELSELGKKFKLLDGKEMFDVLDCDINRMEDIENQESRIKRIMSNSNQTIYHSVTAKEHLPWVEYVFWCYIKKAKEMLGCQVIISLHYDEDSRENGLITERDRQRYKKLHDKYASIAKCVLGNDIKIIDEEDFHKKNSSFFAKNFHNIFVKRMLFYIKQLSENKTDYKQLMRKLSYLESVFPIMCLAEKSNRAGRLYILDRQHAHEIWDEDEKLHTYKERHGIVMITGQTLLKEDGTPLRIFKPNDTININSNNDDIFKALEITDDYVKKNMLLLLSACLEKSPPKDFENLNVKCQQLVIEARTKLDFDNYLII